MKPDTVAPDSGMEAAGQQTIESLDKKPSVAYRSLRNQFIAVVAAQVMFLVGLGGQKAYTLATGTQVILRALPVDPNDLFRGEYASLQYQDISRVKSDESLACNDEVYVLLEKQPDHWVAVRASKERLQAATNQVAVKARVISNRNDSDRTYDLDYGISRLYMPEGRSAQVQTRGKSVYATIAIDASGNACIRSVTVDGAKVYDGTSTVNPFD